MGVGVGPAVAWFPLAPHEVYVPWYHTSRGYVNNVNVTNTRVNVTQVTNVYNTTIINNNTTNVTRITYVNQHVTNAVTAVSHETFVNARPVHDNLVKVDEAKSRSSGCEHNIAAQPAAQSVHGSWSSRNRCKAACRSRESAGGRGQNSRLRHVRRSNSGKSRTETCARKLRPTANSQPRISRRAAARQHAFRRAGIGSVANIHGLQVPRPETLAQNQRASNRRPGTVPRPPAARVAIRWSDKLRRCRRTLSTSRMNRRSSTTGSSSARSAPRPPSATARLLRTSTASGARRETVTNNEVLMALAAQLRQFSKGELAFFCPKKAYDRAAGLNYWRSPLQSRRLRSHAGSRFIFRRAEGSGGARRVISSTCQNMPLSATSLFIMKKSLLGSGTLPLRLRFQSIRNLPDRIRD